MKRIIIIGFLLLCAGIFKVQAQNDPVLAGMILLYTDKAEKELKNQEKVMLMLKNGVLNHRLGSQDKKADLTMEIAKMDFVKLFFGRTDLQTLSKMNKVKTIGDTKAIDIIRSTYEPADPNFKIVLP